MNPRDLPLDKCRWCRHLVAPVGSARRDKDGALWHGDCREIALALAESAQPITARQEAKR